MFKPNSNPYFSAELQQRMADDLALRGMSERTVKGYVRAVRKLAEFCKAAPDQISEPMLRKYFVSQAMRVSQLSRDLADASSKSASRLALISLE